MEETIHHKIPLRLEDGSVIEATLERKPQDKSCRILLEAEGIKETSTSTDYFASFADVRKNLAKKKVFPLCYGASRNVWPSAMARDMGQGLRAYKLELGKHSEEMVHIFDTGDDIDPVTPEEQKEFSYKWFHTPKE